MNLDYDLISTWIATLSGKSSSIGNEVITIRQFLYYLRASGETVYIPEIPKIKDDYVPYIFSENELSLIFHDADNIAQKDKKADPYLPIEFPVILRLLYSCGMRIGETIAVDIADVDLENGILRLESTKGNKHRLVPMDPGMTEILEKYWLSMGFSGKDHGWLFPSGINDGHISDRAIKHRFETILDKNGIRLKNRKKHERGPCLHCMRHVFAFKSFAKAETEGRHLDDAIPFLSIYLGHDSLNETEKYLKFSNELFPESVDAFGRFMNDLLPEVDYGL
jgi:integrase